MSDNKLTIISWLIVLVIVGTFTILLPGIIRYAIHVYEVMYP